MCDLKLYYLLRIWNGNFFSSTHRCIREVQLIVISLRDFQILLKSYRPTRLMLGFLKLSCLHTLFFFFFLNTSCLHTLRPSLIVHLLERQPWVLWWNAEIKLDAGYQREFELYEQRFSVILFWLKTMNIWQNWLNTYFNLSIEARRVWSAWCVQIDIYCDNPIN